MVFKKQSSVFRLSVCGLMVAIGAILGSFFTIPIIISGGEIARISFFMIPVFFIGMLYGPVYGGMVGFSAEIIKAILAGRGISILFPISAMIAGCMFGLFFYKNKSLHYSRIFIASCITQFIQSIVLNSFILHLLYGYPLVMLWPRWIISIANMILFPLILMILIVSLKRAGILIPKKNHCT